MQSEEEKNWVILALQYEKGQKVNLGAPLYGPNYAGYVHRMNGAGLYTETAAKAEVERNPGCKMQAFAVDSPVLRDYLANWHPLRAAEFDQFNQLRAPAAGHAHDVAPADAKQLQIQADQYALSKGLVPDGSLLFTTAAEGFEAGYLAKPAPSSSGVGVPPLADAELAELVGLEQQATPAPWTHWIGSGKIFYGEADTNKPGNYSPANLQLFNAEDYDREDLDTEVEGFNIQPGLAEDDAAFVAALRNALPGLLARLAKAEAAAAPSLVTSGGGPTDGVALIAAERQEQIHKHGWDVKHDADYGRGELAQAACTTIQLYFNYAENIPISYPSSLAGMWPWKSEFGMSFFEKIKDKSEVDKLKVAGALIAAEIDRLQSAAA